MHIRRQIQIAFALARFARQFMTCRRLSPADFAGTAHSKALFGTAVTFHFWHEKLLSKCKKIQMNNPENRHKTRNQLK